MASFLGNILKTQHNKAILSARLFSRNAVRFEKTTPAVAPQAVVEDASKLSGKTHRVNNFEKRMLVWSGKYKSVNDVPSWVAPESVERARNKTRIRLANCMMLATAFACLLMVISGKKAAERGESVQKANIEWHKRVNEDAMKNQK